MDLGPAVKRGDQTARMYSADGSGPSGLPINSLIVGASLSWAPMQRLRLTSHVHFGLALGIATAGVILALSGCVITTNVTGPTQSADSAPAPATLEQFSEDEQARILAVQRIVSEAAAEHQLDPALINAMIWVESRFEPKAKSPAGARGLMQLMPSTAAYLAKRMGEPSARAYDPEFNVRAGALYLAEMKKKFGDEQLAVAAYHAGPGNVKKWVESGQAFPDYSNAYVAKVMEARARFTGIHEHGRRSSARVAAPMVESRPARPTPAPKPMAKPEPESEPEPIEDLIVPDVRTLPDAAEIHGVARVIYERPEPEPEPDYQPVFEVHPELDRKPGALPPGWSVKPAPREATSRPQTRPKPAPPKPTPAKPTPAKAAPAKPETKPQAEPELGIGVLPDL